jgi:hypothetical protein
MTEMFDSQSGEWSLNEVKNASTVPISNQTTAEA